MSTILQRKHTSTFRRKLYDAYLHFSPKKDYEERNLLYRAQLFQNTQARKVLSPGYIQMFARQVRQVHVKLDKRYLSHVSANVAEKKALPTQYQNSCVTKVCACVGTAQISATLAE